MKILNAESMRKDLVGKVRNIRIYNGSAKENLESKMANVAHSDTIEVSSEKWMETKARDELLRDRANLEGKVKLMNAATGYDMATIQALAGLYTIDLVRQADEYADYTPVLFKEVFDEDCPEMVNLRDVMPYVGREGDMVGSDDTVPLMQHGLPIDIPVYQKIRGFGDKTTMRQLVFNPFHKTELVIQSAARILSDEKNNDSFGPIFGATFSAGHKEAADTTSATYDLQLYNTLRKAIRKAKSLVCKPLSRKNGLVRHEVYLLINPMDENSIMPVINGALQNVGGIQQLAPALSLSGVIAYGGGLNDGLEYGKEKLSYPGVPEGKAYIFIKIDSFGGYRIVKRNETMEVGEGDVLGLTSEKKAWHRIRGIHNGFVLPGMDGTTAYGAVVEITLPEFK